MADIKDINHDDIKEFLEANGLKIINNEDDYTEAFKLMDDPNSIFEPISIIKWMMAYNIIITKKVIPDYTVDKLIDLSDAERKSLALKLGMVKDDINNIADILSFLHKIHIIVGDLKIPHKENIYDIFPREIWVKILSELNHRDLDRIIDQSLQLQEIIIEDNIEEKIKTRRFPRASGHCKAFDVSDFPDDVLLLSLDGLLNILYDLKYDLVRGDLICYEGLNSYRNDGIHIYDGYKLIDLDYHIDDYGLLPKEFTVINNGVPIRYWEDNDKNKGLNSNDVWFDNISVKKQCINNIIENNSDIYTTFNYGGKIYKIYASRSEFDGERRFTKNEFVDILSTDDTILLLIDEFNEDENTLYLSTY